MLSIILSLFSSFQGFEVVRDHVDRSGSVRLPRRRVHQRFRFRALRQERPDS